MIVYIYMLCHIMPYYCIQLEMIFSVARLKNRPWTPLVHHHILLFKNISCWVGNKSRIVRQTHVILLPKNILLYQHYIPVSGLVLYYHISVGKTSPLNELRNAMYRLFSGFKANPHYYGGKKRHVVNPMPSTIPKSSPCDFGGVFTIPLKGSCLLSLNGGFKLWFIIWFSILILH